MCSIASSICHSSSFSAVSATLKRAANFLRAFLVEKLRECSSRRLSYPRDTHMPRHSRRFSIPCLCCAIIAAEYCSSASTPRAPAESPIARANQSNAAPIEVDTTRRFQTTIAFDSSLSSGEIAGTVVSASSGAPATMVEVWIDYPGRRHTKRWLLSDAEGHFRIKGLPDEMGILHAGGLGFLTDSVPINPQTRSFVRFALPVTPVTLMY
jgi:hypothetical protein